MGRYYTEPIIGHMDGKGRVFCPTCFEERELASERDFHSAGDIDGNCEGCHRPFPAKTAKVEVTFGYPVPVLRW
jgi:hypothetical protein